MLKSNICKFLLVENYEINHNPFYYRQLNVNLCIILSIHKSNLLCSLAYTGLIMIISVIMLKALLNLFLPPN